MTAKRDSKGHWLPGQSGNPAGRPRGAKDKCQRFRFESVPRSWNCAKNLGAYAEKGGLASGKERSKPVQADPIEELLDGFTIILAASRRKVPNISGMCKGLEMLKKGLTH